MESAIPGILVQTQFRYAETLNVTVGRTDSRFSQESGHLFPRAGDEDFHPSPSIPDPTVQSVLRGKARDEGAEPDSLDYAFHRDNTDDAGLAQASGNLAQFPL